MARPRKNTTKPVLGAGPKAIKTKGRPEKSGINIGIGAGHDLARKTGRKVRIKKPKSKGV